MHHFSPSCHRSCDSDLCVLIRNPWFTLVFLLCGVLLGSICCLLWDFGGVWFHRCVRVCALISQTWLISLWEINVQLWLSFQVAFGSLLAKSTFPNMPFLCEPLIFQPWMSIIMPHGMWVIQIQLYISPITFPHFSLFRYSVCAPLSSVSTPQRRNHPPPGWNKASLSVDASEENDGYSSGEDPMNSDPEDEVGKKLVSLNRKGFTFSIWCPIFCRLPSDSFNASLAVFGDL